MLKINKQKKLSPKKILSLIGITVLLANSITLYITFLFAYFNNGKIIVYVNNMGEANFEFILIPVTIILGLYALKRCVCE